MPGKPNRKSVSRKATKPRKHFVPPKPFKDFPLTPHASGKWQKKIRGKIYYFGNWGRVNQGVLTRVKDDGWQDALQLYKAQAEDLQAGRTPRGEADPDALTVAALCNRFLTAKLRKLEAGRMTSRSFQEYRGTTDRLVRVFGKGRLVDDLRPDDFEGLLADISKTWGLTRLGNEITRVRSVFRYAHKNGLIPREMVYGTEFVKPDAKEMRLHRAKQGKKLFETEELHLSLPKNPSGHACTSNRKSRMRMIPFEEGTRTRSECRKERPRDASALTGR